ncbi:MAG: ATP-dependent helicase HrpB [Planctomycetes bacterium]|nr:ATP-dependent helicase HrpB [Planctomycetota bacterium]
MLPLPIDPLLPEIVARLQDRNCLVLQAPTGAGKTTRVPGALLDAGRAGNNRILLLEPRRLAARAAARRMSAERGTALGEDVGYHVRFDKCWGLRTRIIAVTPGILLRQLQDDPFLEKTGVVLFDEFHERSLDNDLALGLARLVQQTVRPDLRLVVMSATLDGETIARYLGGCPILVGEGRQYPVEIVYEPKPAHQSWPLAAAAAVERLLPRIQGDLLVFLPGLQEIRQTARHLESTAEQLDLAVLPLHGDLPAEKQDAVLLKQDRRKVVLATNVAETSVTVEGITGIVDTGLARQLQLELRLGLDRLKLTPISKASADQRAGRAGRMQPGVCVRLWSEVAHHSRPDHTTPEIRRVDLAGAVLQLLAMAEKDVAQFPWLEPPQPGQIEQAQLLLRRLGAVDDAHLTEIGHRLARLPVHPRLGRLLVEGHRLGRPEKPALAAALLAERDPFQRAPDESRQRAARHSSASDVLDRVDAIERFERGGQSTGPLGVLHRHAARFILRARSQLLRVLPQELGSENPADMPADEILLRSLLAAFPDRVVRRRHPGSDRGVMVGGRGVRLAPQSAVRDGELFLAIDVDAGEKESWVRIASSIEREWLPAHLVSDRIEAAFDSEAEKVVARRRLRFDDLLIEESAASLPDEDETARLLADAAAANLDRVLPADDSTAGTFRTRVRWLRAAMPELALPALEDNDLRESVRRLCLGKKSFEELRRGDWLSAFQQGLTYAQRQALEREAPERLAVPSGNRITLKYEVGRPPVLAVRIQELFGLRDTPRLAGGRVKVVLHLLGPNFRPQQVTDDLASFWANTYPQVRKDLRARYPKHAWPEDPLSAEPTRRSSR